MKIKMLIGMAGIDFSITPGEETERFSDAEAQRMIDQGVAVLVEVPGQKREKAVKKPASERRG